MGGHKTCVRHMNLINLLTFSMKITKLLCKQKTTEPIKITASAVLKIQEN